MITLTIDPDINKSGFAWVREGERNITSGAMPFSDLIALAKMLNETEPVTAIVEAGWMNKSVFRISPYDTKAVVAKKGYSVGENHRTGKLLIEALEHEGIKVKPQAPLRKLWRGTDKKITHTELMKLLLQKGFRINKNRTNQDERDAILILLYSIL